MTIPNIPLVIKVLVNLFQRATKMFKSLSQENILSRPISTGKRLSTPSPVRVRSPMIVSGFEQIPESKTPDEDSHRGSLTRKDSPLWQGLSLRVSTVGKWRDSTVSNGPSPTFESRRESILGGEDTELETHIVRLNIGGTIFNTTKDSLRRYPDTLLGSITPNSPFFNRRKREYFFDRNPTIFSAILDLYRTGELHLPRNFCGNAALRELEFWEVPAIWVSACCWSNIHDAIQDKRLHQDLQVSDVDGSGGRIAYPYFSTCRKWLWRWLYNTERQTIVYQFWNNLIALIIVTTLVLIFVDSLSETHPHVYYNDVIVANGNHRSKMPRRNDKIWVANACLLGVMVVEFLFKLSVCPNIRHFFKSVVNICYGFSLLACVAGHVAENILEKPENWEEEGSLDGAYLLVRCSHFLLMIRFFEVLDRNASLRVMWIAIRRCRTELYLLIVVFAVLAVFFGALAHFCEQFSSKRLEGNSTEDNGSFKHLDTSLYWAIITMTTVGYGDITPQTRSGRVIGALCSISGVIVLAMPVAVLTESFQQYNLRQKIRQEKRKRQDDFFSKTTPLNTFAGVGLHEALSL